MAVAHNFTTICNASHASELTWVQNDRIAMVDLQRGGAGAAFKEVFFGDTPRPRVAVGVGVNWNSPFGPLRIDVAKALISAPGDDTKLITFNVGTQF